MDTRPLVSIIIPVYNVEQHIKDTVKSVQNQTYEHVEIMLIDDGSPDNSGIICDELAKSDNRIKVIHQKNMGVTKARKNGIEASTGEWIVFLDGDDQLLPTAIEYFVETALAKNVDIVQTPNIRVCGNTRTLNRMGAKGKYDKKGYLSLLANKKITGGIGGKIIRKSLFNSETLNIPEGITNNEDMLMNIRLSDKLNSIYCDPKNGFYLYFDREGSASKKKILLTNWQLLYKEYYSMKERYGSVMYVCIANSVHERYTTKNLTLEECKEFMKEVKIDLSTPLYTWFIKLYFTYPNKLTGALMRVACGIHVRL